MMNIKKACYFDIADFSVDMQYEMPFYKNFPKYEKCATFPTDFSFSLNYSDIDYEKENKKDDLYYNFNKTAIHRKIGEIIPYFNAFVLHSVIIDINGVGVSFSAKSGTGKSTHLANWYAYLNGTENMPESLKRLLKDENLNIEKDGSLPKLTIVNGDKPIVRFFDEDFCKQNNLEIPNGTEFGIPYAYGTPWNGKENLGCNMRTPLKHICFIERSDTNFVTKIDKAQAVERIMQQVYMPKDPVALSKTLELVNRLINSCELWIIHCNMEPESAEVAYKAIFG